jgi:hypothetical protein
VALARVVITKEMPLFRGRPERYSNGYTFNLTTGSTTDEALMHSLATAVINIERVFHAAAIKFVYATAGPKGEDAVYVEEYTSPASGQISNAFEHPEICVLAQARIARRRYLTKYFHTEAHSVAAANSDAFVTSLKAVIENSLGNLQSGTLPGAAKACAPDGTLPVGAWLVDPYMRTHQLKARGKRPQAG